MSLIQELINLSNVGGLLQPEQVKRFTPIEIREAIQSLVATEQMELAYALGAAGLSIHPQSEDMLAINGLLALMQQDWEIAVEMLQELMDIQGENTQAFTYVMLVRALRCNLDPAKALQVARQGLKAYPEQLELVAESLSLEDYADLVGESSQIQ
jgi:tetratricopeptide (TPR) repeat protein